MKVLIIQKDLSFAKELKNHWKIQGKLVDVSGNYEEALSFFHQADYHIVVIDTWIKGGNAFTFASKIRERNPKVVLFFLSEDSSYLFKKQAFEVGADVFFSKEKSLEEITWQLDALGRRVLMQEEYQKQQLHWDNIKIDLLKREIYQGEQRLDFTGKEFQLFVLLLKNRGLVLHRDILRRELCGEEAEISSNIIDSYIKNIRKKIGDVKKEGIKTVRGYGYGIEEKKKGE